MITLYNNPLLLSNFVLEYWKVIYWFSASLSNNYLTILMLKYAVVTWFHCWYIFLFTTKIKDIKINLLVHLIYFMVYLVFLVSRAGTISSQVTQGFDNLKQPSRLITKLHFPSRNLNYRRIHSYITLYVSFPPRFIMIPPLRWFFHL